MSRDKFRSLHLIDIWTIYERPIESPDSYVVRLWEVYPGRCEPVEMHTYATLAEARKSLPAGLHCMNRNPADDPSIVESWI